MIRLFALIVAGVSAFALTTSWWWVGIVIIVVAVAWVIREVRWLKAQRRELLERHQERLRTIAREHGREP
jgi:membrane protein implicated in regulation of membrane protease activity